MQVAQIPLPPTPTTMHTPTMQAPQIFHISDTSQRRDSPAGAYLLVSPGTALGGPLSIHTGDDDEKVVAAYRRWLFTSIKQGDERVVTALGVIRPGLALACDCTRERCHTGVLVRGWRWWKERG